MQHPRVPHTHFLLRPQPILSQDGRAGLLSPELPFIPEPSGSAEAWSQTTAGQWPGYLRLSLYLQTLGSHGPVAFPSVLPSTISPPTPQCTHHKVMVKIQG